MAVGGRAIRAFEWLEFSLASALPSRVFLSRARGSRIAPGGAELPAAKAAPPPYRTARASQRPVGARAGACVLFLVAACCYVVPKISQATFNSIWKTRLALLLSALALAVRRALLRGPRRRLPLGRRPTAPGASRSRLWARVVRRARALGRGPRRPPRRALTLSCLQASQLLPLQLWDPQYGAVRFLPKGFRTYVLCKVFTVVALGICQPYMLFLAAWMCSYGIRCDKPKPRFGTSRRAAEATSRGLLRASTLIGRAGTRRS